MKQQLLETLLHKNQKRQNIPKIILFTFLLLCIYSLGYAQATPQNYQYGSTTYETVQNGKWTDASTWKNRKVPPNDIRRGVKVIVRHHVDHNKGIRIKFKGILIIQDATLTIEKGGLKLLDQLSILYIERGALISKKNQVRNQKGIVALDYGGIQVCNTNYVDQTRWFGGTFGNGYIYANNGNIRNHFRGGFSRKIEWCAENGNAIGMVTESRCDLFTPLSEGDCSDPFFYLTFFDNDQDGISNLLDLDNDNDGIPDAIEYNGYEAFGDEDGDGVFNYLDTSDNGNNGDNSLTDYTDTNNDNVPDVYDSDLDGVVDFFDLDSDNDGIPDTIEAQTSTGYISGSNFTDTNGNGMNDAYEDVEGNFLILPVDTDFDGIPDYLDLDADDDGVLDLIESDSNLLDTNNDGRVEGIFGVNGLINSQELQDTYEDNNGNYDDTQIDNFPDEDYDANLGGEVDYKDNEFTKPPMITQVYNSVTDRWIEITNPSISNTIPGNRLYVTLYNSLLEGLVTVPPISYQILSEIEPGKSILIKNTTALIDNISGTPENSDQVTAFGLENTLVLSIQSGNQAWESRFDVISNIESNTSYVRVDFDNEPSQTFIQENWVQFVDDNLDALVSNLLGGPERHPNDPLLSEVQFANDKANSKLGEHRFGAAERVNGQWINGFPDRSREVIISEDYVHEGNRLSARTLEVRNESKLVVKDQALIVTDHIHINQPSDEIRLSGTSQLIQTHTGESQATGSGKFYIDRATNLKSIYRYNYLSSPVHSGNAFYSVGDVLKDGTDPTSLTSIPREINFIDGFNGAPTSPISIAEYWIFSFGQVNGVGQWIQKKSQGLIPATDGFLMKGPGTWQNYTFIGVPNDGTLTTEVGGSNSYFLGNPYPSAINARKFIEDNLDAIDGTLYFWDHVGEEDTSTSNSGHNVAGYIGGYAIINLSMSLAANSPLNPATDINNIVADEEYKQPKPYIAVGQGFFATGDSDGGTIQFKNSQREYQTEGENSIFFRMDRANATVQRDEIVREDLPVIKLGLDYTNRNGVHLHRQIGISFSPTNSFAHDRGFDSEINDLGDTDMYWKFPNNDKKYIIAGVEAVRENLQIPLEVVIGSSSEEIKFTIDMIQNIDQDVYIYDAWEERFYSIREEKPTFNISQGTYQDRFYITFSKNRFSEDLTATTETQIFNDASRSELVIRKKENTNVERVTIFNILGKQVGQWNRLENLASEQRISVGRLSGLHIVEVKTTEGIITKKIVF